jgi:dTDP-glucose 4,6-dehydratase
LERLLKLNVMDSMILVTGGAGFIGSNFILQQLKRDPASIVNLDKLTYAGNLHNLESVVANPRYEFTHGDMGDRNLVGRLLEQRRPSSIVHFAAESHVDRSIRGPDDFIRTNVDGTLRNLRSARRNADVLDQSHQRRARSLPLPSCFNG